MQYVNCDTDPLTSTHVYTIQQSLYDILKEWSIPDLQLLFVCKKESDRF